MKIKKILFSAMLFPALALSQSQRVYVDSRGRDCSGGLGLCSAGTTSQSNRTIETTFKKMSDNSIAMVLDNKIISETDQRKITGKTFSEMKAKGDQYFVQDSDFILEENLLKQININQDFYLIKQGKYPIVFEENKCQVIFTISKK